MTASGVPVYRRKSIPSHLRSYRQLAREGLRPAHIRKPDGMYARRTRSGETLWVLLYDQKRARPYICTTKVGGKGVQILEIKRERYTCKSCGIFVNDWKRFREILAGDGRCASCSAKGAP